MTARTDTPAHQDNGAPQALNTVEAAPLVSTVHPPVLSLSLAMPLQTNTPLAVQPPVPRSELASMPLSPLPFRLVLVLPTPTQHALAAIKAMPAAAVPRVSAAPQVTDTPLGTRLLLARQILPATLHPPQSLTSWPVPTTPSPPELMITATLWPLVTK